MKKLKPVPILLCIVGFGLLFLPTPPDRNSSFENPAKTPRFDDQAVLTASTDELPQTLNPNHVQSIPDQDIVGLLYDGLVVLQGVTARLTPHLLTSWSYDPNNFTYDLTLRPNVWFWDGIELTATHIARNFETWLQPDSLSSALLTHIEGAEGFRKSKAESLVGIKVLGKHKLRIVLTRPDGLFLRKLANVRFKVFRHNQEGLIGTGPFMPHLNDSSSISFKANPNYFLGRPHFRAIRILEIPSQRVAQALRDQTIDLTWNLFYSPITPRPASYVEHADFGDRTLLLYLNNSFRHFDSVNKRLALFAAIDRQHLVSQCGIGTPAATIIPPDHLGHTKRPQPWDAEASGAVQWPDFTETLFVEAQGLGSKCLVDGLNTAFNKAAIPVNAREVPFSTIERAWKEKRLAAGIELFSFPPDFEMKAFLYFSRDNPINLGGKNSDEHEFLIDLIKHSNNIEARAALLRKLDTLTQTNGYALPISHLREIYYIKDDLHIGDTYIFRRTPDWRKIGRLML